VKDFMQQSRNQGKTAANEQNIHDAMNNRKRAALINCQPQRRIVDVHDKIHNAKEPKADYREPKFTHEHSSCFKLYQKLPDGGEEMQTRLAKYARSAA
jgi:hypothetical protein